MGKLNVVIADDNEVMRDLLEEMVTSDDELHLIGMAKDGEEACHLIREKEPDVVLLDIIMPKLDGLAVLDRIRADHTLKNRPTFLMISGISNEKITEDAFERGADYYIPTEMDDQVFPSGISKKITPKLYKLKDTEIYVFFTFPPFLYDSDNGMIEIKNNKGVFYKSPTNP
jgi:two-component system response regulator (stage 0 sporulation protein A)